MATITEVTGKSYKILADATAGIWHKISMWTKASDVYNNSDKNLQTTCGSITGITSSLTSTSTTMAASASAIKQLNDKIAVLNSNLIGKFEGSCRIVTLTNTYASYCHVNTKNYKKLTINITSFSGLTNVAIKDLDDTNLYTKSSTGTFELDITAHDVVNITATAISGTAGSAVLNYTIE